MTSTAEKPTTTYRIHRKANTLVAFKFHDFISIIGKRKYKVNEKNDQEILSITGGWQLLSKLLLFSLIFPIILILLGIIIHYYSGVDFYIIALKPISTILIWIGIIITFVIIVIFAMLKDVSIFTVQNPDGSPMGEIRCNLTRSTWKVLGLSEENQVCVKLRSSKYLHSGLIETPFSTFKASAPIQHVQTSQHKGYYVATKFKVINPNGNRCFTVNWVDHESNPRSGSEYRIDADSQDKMSPFLTFTVSVCLIDKFLRKYKYYDHTPGRVDYSP